MCFSEFEALVANAQHADESSWALENLFEHELADIEAKLDISSNFNLRGNRLFYAYALEGPGYGHENVKNLQVLAI